MVNLRLTVGVAAAAAVALLLSGCAGSPGETAAGGDAGSDGSTVAVTVGAPSVGPAAALQFGKGEGWFAENGLDPDITLGVAGAALLPAVSTGETTFGVGNPLSVLAAASKGVQVRILSGYSFSKATGDDINAVVAKAGTGINEWKDLDGKRVAVNAVNTQGDLTINASVDGAGGDSSTIKYTEIAFPDALAQLDAGNVDAVWIPEPFLSQALAQPDKYVVVGYPNQTALPGLPTMVTFASSKVIEDQPELVEKWRASLKTTLGQATDDREAYAKVVADVLGTPIETTLKQNPESLDYTLDPQIIQDLADLALKYGFITSEPDLDKVIVP
ncbi:transporter substrate-binding domain-containing protein [Microbacterium protaetiae]|uniref:Transporter substrate-binding domain-containing protein n=1 Tax=Microbacterium protaetiae TaxID=2509458 RepID=A0A4P6EAZ7_9MICO|nr:ABC transporter substrate-binding protein [Microbacterium protaetiae]QAY59164.1 transporter substrate-binding domain-containing protein [Microbacterium protaetiae]